MTDEPLDLVDANDNVVGSVQRKDAHGNPDLIHREIGVAVVNTSGEVLLQKRSLDKESDPGIWKVAAAGHVNQGEDPQDAASRELLEELGIKAKLNFLEKVFKVRKVDGKPFESRFFWIYYAVLESRPKVTFDPHEVAEVQWVKVSELENFSKTHEYPLNDINHRVNMDVARKAGII